MSLLSDLIGTVKTSFRIGRATFNASGLTAARTITIPDADITLGAGGLTEDQIRALIIAHARRPLMRSGG